MVILNGETSFLLYEWYYKYGRLTQPVNICCRKNSRNGCKLGQLSSWRMFKLGGGGYKILNIRPHLLETSLMSIGLGTLADFGSAASDIVPVVDHVLLVASIFLTYMARAIPVEKSYTGGQKILYDKKMVAETSDSSGR